MNMDSYLRSNRPHLQFTSAQFSGESPFNAFSPTSLPDQQTQQAMLATQLGIRRAYGQV